MKLIYTKNTRNVRVPGKLAHSYSNLLFEYEGEEPSILEAPGVCMGRGYAQIYFSNGAYTKEEIDDLIEALKIVRSHA